MIFGLAAALGWGCSDLLAAIGSRRMGSRATVMVAQIVGLLCCGLLWVVTTPEWRLPAVDGPWAMLSLIFPAYYVALSLWLQFRP